LNECGSITACLPYITSDLSKRGRAGPCPLCPSGGNELFLFTGDDILLQQSHKVSKLGGSRAPVFPAHTSLQVGLTEPIPLSTSRRCSWSLFLGAPNSFHFDARLFTDARIPRLKATWYFFLSLPLHKKLCTKSLGSFTPHRRLLPLMQIATMVSSKERNNRAELTTMDKYQASSTTRPFWAGLT
jgi:hypothetical protein